MFTHGFVSEFLLILPFKEETKMFSYKAEGKGADLVGQALGFQLLFFESLLQSKNLGLVLLHCQLHHLARLGDPLVSSRPAREAQACCQEPHTTDPEGEGWSSFKQAAGWTEAQPWILPLNAVFLPDSLQSKKLTHFRLGLKLPWSSKGLWGLTGKAEEEKSHSQMQTGLNRVCPVSQIPCGRAMPPSSLPPRNQSTRGGPK